MDSYSVQGNGMECRATLTLRVRKSEESQCSNYAPPLIDATDGSEEVVQRPFTVSRLC